MNKVRLPIETYRDGNKITKVCVEDIYKMLNRIIVQIDKLRNICDSADKVYKDYEGSLIVGTGISQPCITDAFDEEIGNNIAFMKAKLNANIKKRNLLIRLWNQALNVSEAIDQELLNVDEYILMDLNGVRTYNPEYLIKFDDELKTDFENYEIQEEASEA